MTAPLDASPEIKAMVERLERAAEHDRNFLGPSELLPSRTDELEDAAALLRRLGEREARMREPTYEMLEAGIASLGSDDDRSSTEVAMDLWSEMVAALAAAGKEGE